MEISSVIQGKNIEKSYKGFTLNIPKIKIPKGFATALIGENGAGKTTLLHILAGLRLDYQGEVYYFDEREKDVERAKERLGYAGCGCYFLPSWKISQVEQVSELLFDGFDRNRYRNMCRELGLGGDLSKKVSALSDGNRMKLTLAAVLSRPTECLLLDEPASSLDPLMRERLCEMLREYLEEGNGEKSLFFSTHNISDMENVTDYCIIMKNGGIAEQGFVEDLKEKYILVKGEAKDAEAAKGTLYSYSGSSYGFEGICLSEDMDKLAGMDVSMETPSLFQISVAVMKANTPYRKGSCEG